MSHSLSRRVLVGAAALFVCLLGFASLWTSSQASSAGSIEADASIENPAALAMAGSLVEFLPGFTDADPLTSAWERAQDAGAYRFSSNVEQTTTPTASVLNAGRSSRSDRFYLEGDADIANDAMEFRLWSNGGSVLQEEDSLGVRVADGKTFTQQDGGEWQEGDDFTATIAPAGDFMNFLSAAYGVTDLGAETSAGVTFTRYAFQIDGPAFALIMLEQYEESLRQAGDVPPGATFTAPVYYSEMTGNGELWVGEDGLPIRQRLSLRFPEQDNEFVSAQISVDFSGFEQQSPAVTAGAATTGSVTSGIAAAGQTLTSALSSAASNLGLIAAALLSVLMMGLVIYFRRVRQLQQALAVAVIASMVIGPLLSTFRITAFSDRQIVLAAEQEMRQAERNLSRELMSQGAAEQFDPHQSQLALAQPSAYVAAPAYDVTYDAVAAPTLDVSAAAFSEVDSGLDSDGDTLTDFVEVRIGTSEVISDTDGDTVLDALEVNGFVINGVTWYSDPTEVDSNGDGLSDTLEWDVNGDGNVEDSDNDGIPDLFDDDNDNDDVPDKLDLAPFTKAPSPFSEGNPLKLTVNDLTGITPETAVPTFVDFQVRPTNEQQLWFAFNLMDWPGDDKAQIQDIDGKGEDLKLVPMLEITIPDADKMLPPAATLPPYSEANPYRIPDLAPYGISANPPLTTTTEQTAYVPLNLVTDQESGERVAFSGRMRYLPQAPWLQPHDVQLVWVVQVETDVCAPQLTEECDNGYLYNQPQIIHRYYEGWTLTGLKVTEEHGTDIAIMYEDPQAPLYTGDDGATWALSDVLGQRFLTPKADGSGSETTLSNLRGQYDRTENGGGNEARYGLPNVFTVNTFTYETMDEALNTTAVTETVRALNENFAGILQADPAAKPLMMYAYESNTRGLGLDLLRMPAGGYGGFNGSQLTLDMHPSGQEDTPVSRIAGIKWTPYCATDSASGGTEPNWAACELDVYWQELETRHADEFLDPNDTTQTIATLDPEIAAGQTVITQLYALTLIQGINTIVQQSYAPDDVRIVSGVYASETDSELGEKVRFGVQTGRTAAKVIANEVFRHAIQQNGPLQVSNYTATLGKLTNVTQLAVSDSKIKKALNGLGTLKDALKKNSAAKNLAIGAGVVVGLAALGTAIYLLTSGDSGDSSGDSSGGSNAGKIVLKSIIFATQFIFSGFLPLWTVRGLAIKFGVDGAKNWAAARSASSEFAGTTNKAAVIGAAVGLGIAWGFFIAGIVSSNIAAFSPQFNKALASTVAETLMILIFTALSLSGIGLLISGLIAAIDLLLTFICELGVDELNGVIEDGGCFTLNAFFTKLLSSTFYAYDLMIDTERADFAQTGNPDFTLANQTMGYIAGNQLSISMPVSNTIAHKSPDPWSLPLLLPYIWLFSEGSLLGTDIRHDLAVTAEEPLAEADRMQWGPASSNGSFLAHPLSKASATKRLELPNQLVAGINRPFDASFNSAYGLPAYECVGIPPFPFFFPLIPVCWEDTFTSNSSQPFDSVFFDVLPATLDDFIQLAERDVNQYALGWDDKFQAMPDADGDGLISSAFGGLDFNDNDWDADNDGLSDTTELLKRQEGLPFSLISPDTDGDGLTDAQELAFGTNPGRRDTDNDGLLDSEEVRHIKYIQNSGGVGVQLSSPPRMVGGWAVEIRGALSGSNPGTIMVSSDPLNGDGDGDGISDQAEKELALSTAPQTDSDGNIYYPNIDENGLPYHPNIVNKAPVTVFLTTDDFDGYVGPNQSLGYTTTVVANTPLTSSVLNITAPSEYGAPRPPALLAFDPASFSGTQTVAIGGQLTVSQLPSADISLNADIRARLTGNASQTFESETQALPEIALAQGRQTAYIDLTPVNDERSDGFSLSAVHSDVTSAQNDSNTRWGDGEVYNYALTETGVGQSRLDSGAQSHEGTFLFDAGITFYDAVGESNEGEPCDPDYPNEPLGCDADYDPCVPLAYGEWCDVPATIKAKFTGDYALSVNAKIKGEADYFDGYSYVWGEWSIKDDGAEYVIYENDYRGSAIVTTGPYSISSGNGAPSVACTRQGTCMTVWEHREGDYIRLVGAITNANGNIVRGQFHLRESELIRAVDPNSGGEYGPYFPLEPTDQTSPIVSVSGNGFRVTYHEVAYNDDGTIMDSRLSSVGFNANGNDPSASALSPYTFPYDDQNPGASINRARTASTYQFVNGNVDSVDENVIYRTTGIYTEGRPPNAWDEVVVSDAALDSVHDTANDPVRGRTLLVYVQTGGAIVGKFLDSPDTIQIAPYGFSPHVAYNPFTDGWIIGYDTTYLGAVGVSEVYLYDSALQSRSPLWTHEANTAPTDSAVACPSWKALPLLDLQFEELPGVTGFGDSSNFARTVLSVPDSLPTAGYVGGVDAADTPIGTLPSDFSARFDGVDDYLSIANDVFRFNQNFSADSSFTAALWLQSTDTDGLLAGLGNGSALSLRDGKPTLTVTGRQLQANTPVNDGAWHYVVATHQGGQLRLYVDGLPATTTASTGTVPDQTDFNIGGRPDGSDQFAGLLDNVEFYGAALGAKTVADLYGGTRNGYCVAAAANAATSTPSGIQWASLSFPPVETRGGKITASAETVLTVDVDKPTSELLGYENNTVVAGQRTIIIGGNATDNDGSGMAKVEVSITGNGYDGSWQQATGADSWSFALNVTNGNYSIRTRATDAVGNEEENVSETVTLQVDDTPLDVTLNPPTSDPVRPTLTAENQWTIGLNGNVNDGATTLAPELVEVQLVPSNGLVTVRDWQQATVNGNSWALDYRFPLSIGDVTGSYSVRVRGVDAVGNRTTDDAATGAINIDAAPPTAILSTLDSTRTVISDTITLSGRITETGAAGIASLEIGLTPLEHIVALPDGFTDAQADAQLAAERQWFTAGLTSGAGASASDWTFHLPATLEDNFQMDLRVTDTLGNQATLSSVWRGVIDTVAPRVTIDAAVIQEAPDGAGGRLYQTEYRCTAEDAYLSEADFTCPYNSGQQPARTYDPDGNLGTLFPGQAILNTLAVTNTVWLTSATSTGSMMACDLLGKCTSSDLAENALAAAGVQAASIQAASSTPQGVVISPQNGTYVADDDATVNVTIVAEAAQGMQEAVVLVEGNPAGSPLTFAQGKTSVQKTLPIPFPGEGTYELRVRVTDSQGVTVDGEPVSFTLDQQPPTVALDPGTLTTSDTWALGSEVLVFSGTATDTQGLAWVKIRSGDGLFKDVKVTNGNQWEAAIVIPDSQTQTAVEVTVRARDRAGRITQLSNNQSVDLTSGNTPPDTVILTPPTGAIGVNSVTVGFEGIDGSNEAAAFACRLDEGKFVACGNPQTFSNLSNGGHRLEVRSIDAQGFVDPTPAVAEWTVNVVELSTTIDLAQVPANPTFSRDARFVFGSSQGASSFECALDGAAYAPCGNEQTYSGLRDGQHIFQVRGLDGAGNAGASSRYVWRVQNAAPVAENTSATTFIDTAIDITLTASDSDPVTYEVVEQPANGSVQFVGSNIVRYTPDSGITGEDRFTFRASDGQEFSELATVNVLVNFEPVITVDPPVQSVRFSDGITPVTVTAFDEDSPGNTLVVSSTWSDGVNSYPGLPEQLSLRPVSNNDAAIPGQALWTLGQTAQLPTGTYTVSVTADDGIGTTTGDPVNIVFNETPVAISQVLAVGENSGEGVTVTLVVNDVDTLIYGIVDEPQHGQLSGDAPNLVYRPDPDYYGPDSFTFQADDPWSSSNVATANVTVRLAEFVVYADESTALGKEIAVVSGSVGVNRADGSTFEKDAELGIGDKVQMMDPASRIVADSIKIGKDATVYNPAYNEIDIDKKNTSVLGTSTTPLAVPVQPLPALPADFTSGAEKLEIQKNEVRQLAPGVYGELDVKKDATVVLTGGLYHFESWKLEDKATVYVQGPTEIRIAGQVEFKKESVFGPDPATPDIFAGDIVLYVAGANDKKGEIKDKPALEVGDKSTISAYIVVPNGTLLLGKETNNIGGFIGKWVKIEDKGTLAPNESAIDAIVEAARTLALNAIAEAEAAGGKEKEIDKVREEMEKAQSELDKNNPLKALEHYQNAIEDAQKAMGKVKGAEATDSEEIVNTDMSNTIFLPIIVLSDSPAAADQPAPSQSVEAETDAEEVDEGEENDTEAEHRILLPLVQR